MRAFTYEILLRGAAAATIILVATAPHAAVTGASYTAGSYGEELRASDHDLGLAGFRLSDARLHPPARETGWGGEPVILFGSGLGHQIDHFGLEPSTLLRAQGWLGLFATPAGHVLEKAEVVVDLDPRDNAFVISAMRGRIVLSRPTIAPTNALTMIRIQNCL